MNLPIRFIPAIRAHAREHASLVFASIERDLADGVSVDLFTELREVDAAAEYEASHAAFALDYPDGCEERVKLVWQEAFADSLALLAWPLPKGAVA